MHFPDMTSQATSSDRLPRLFVSGNNAKDGKYSPGRRTQKSCTVRHYGLHISSTFNPRFYLLILTLLCPDFFRVLGNSRIEFPVQQGTGVVTATMYLYQDSNYATVFNGVPVLTTTDMLYVKIALDTVLNGVYIISKQCWATPDEAGLSSERFDIIEPPGCLKSSVTNGALTSNGISEESRFQLQVFQFLPTTVVYLHCQVQLCTPSSPGSCQPSCSGSRRRRRRRDLGETKLMTSQLIIRVDGDLILPPDTPAANNTDGNTSDSESFEVTILLPVLLGLVLLLMLAIIGLFVWIYVRNRRGK